MSYIDSQRELFDKSIDHLKNEISVLRTGRATPALVEDIIVEAYGIKQQLKAVASISVADAKTLNIDPWDKGLTQAVEEAIRKSDIGINPVNDGTLIRLPLPELTAERRADLIKILHKKLEEARISVRKIREDIRGEIDKKEKSKEISEDEKYDFQDELDEVVQKYNKKIKKVGEDKEVEINKV
jgi:ribosome recycling factor